MHVPKIREVVTFDSTAALFDDSVITLDINTTIEFFTFFPYAKIIGNTLTGNFFNERTRVSDTISLNAQPSIKGTYRAFIDIDDFIVKDTYRFELLEDDVEVYRGKLFIFDGDTQNYSVVGND